MRYEYLKIYMKSEIQNRNYSNPIEIARRTRICTPNQTLLNWHEGPTVLSGPPVNDPQRDRERGCRLPPFTGNRGGLPPAISSRWGRRRPRGSSGKAPGRRGASIGVRSAVRGGRWPADHVRGGSMGGIADGGGAAAFRSGETPAGGSIKHTTRRLTQKP
jgi:hypothetical protein